MSEPILTFAQVVDRYQFTRRKLRNIIRKFSIPVLHYGGDIDDIRFDDVALTALDEALRCPSKSSAANLRAPSRSRVRYAQLPATASAYNDVLALTTSPSPKEKPPASPPKSTPAESGNVVPIGHSPKR